MSSQEVRLNIRKNTFQKGSLAKQPWEGRSFDNPEDRRAYLLDRNFSGTWDVRPGDQVKAMVVHQTDKFVYVIPPDADAPAQPAKKEAAPAPAPQPVAVDDGYEDYVSPASQAVSDESPVFTQLVADLDRANKVLDRTKGYYERNVTKIALRYRKAKLVLDARAMTYRANIKSIRKMGGSDVFITELEDLLSAVGREEAKLDDHMKGEIHRMTWLFLAKDNVQEDMLHVYESENLFAKDEFDTRAANHLFVLWMYSRGKYHESMAENAWKFLVMTEEATIQAALGQKSL